MIYFNMILTMIFYVGCLSNYRQIMELYIWTSWFKHRYVGFLRPLGGQNWVAQQLDD